MSTHRNKKSESRRSVSQNQPRTLLNLPDDLSPVNLEKGEALERVLRERAALPPLADPSDNSTTGESPLSPAVQQVASGGLADESSEGCRNTEATPYEQIPLDAFQADFFCDSRTPIPAAAIAEQIRACGIDSGSGPPAFGMVAQTRFRDDSISQPKHPEDAELLQRLDSRLVALRTILLKELQASFADLQSFQKTAWDEQKGILQGLSRDLRPNVRKSASSDASTSAPMVQDSAESLVEAWPTTPPPAVTVPDRLSAVDTASVSPQGSPAHQRSAVYLQPERRFQSSERQDTSFESTRSNAPRTWEDIRRELLSECEAREEQLNAGHAELPFELPEHFYSPGNAGASELQQIAPALLEKPVLPAAMPDEEFLNSIPEAVDPETLNDQQLRDAFLERETFLSQLISRFRSRQEARTVLLTAEQLRGLLVDCPADMARLVQQSLRGLDELTRLGELEMAMERARLARLRNQLQQSRQQVEVRARHLGLTLNDDGTLGHGSQSSSKSSNRRWLNKLGFGHERR